MQGVRVFVFTIKKHLGAVNSRYPFFYIHTKISHWNPILPQINNIYYYMLYSPPPPRLTNFDIIHNCDVVCAICNK